VGSYCLGGKGGGLRSQVAQQRDHPFQLHCLADAAAPTHENRRHDQNLWRWWDRSSSSQPTAAVVRRILHPPSARWQLAALQSPINDPSPHACV
jgi:hypothetical protein